jgi:Tfp pilus assembly protein PilE
MRIILILTILSLIAIGAYGLAIDRPIVAVHAAMLTVFPLALAAIGIRK